MDPINPTIRFHRQIPRAYEHGICRISYGHAIFASIGTNCITIADVFTGACVSPPLCPSLFSVASQYGYYNDQIYFGVTAAMYHPLHTSLSASFMAYLFGELKVMLDKSASTCHITNYPLNML
jgi:hypothetical protein